MMIRFLVGAYGPDSVKGQYDRFKILDPHQSLANWIYRWIIYLR